MHDHEEVTSNHSANRTFEDVLGVYASRRSVMIGGLAGAALAMFGMGAAHAAGARAVAPTRRTAAAAAKRGPKIGFASIPMQSGPTPTIAAGYQYAVLAPWREKLDGSGTSFPYAGFTAEQQEQSIGIGHDGMWYFGNEKSGMLAINHEYGTFPHLIGKAVPTSLAEVRLSQAAHGVSMVMIENAKGGWRIKKSGKNRRITVNTPATFSGPAANSALLVNTAGNAVLGTLNNCANGYTPWGTYLTCEENFNGYFGATDPSWKASAEEARYGVTSSGFGYEWHKFDSRFDRSSPGYANEINRFGWVVEIDPDKPSSAPVKRTALGRVKHEGADVVVGKGNRTVVYMGDDERFDYIYKFVSSGDWKKIRAAGKSPLDEGTLYVAKFNDDGSGQWLELSPSNPMLASWTIDMVLVRTRQAADLVGATKMDRPEWISHGPKGEMYVTLTNNSRRGASGQPRPDAANPRSNNTWGHIIRFTDADRHVGLTFAWEIFALADETFDETGQMFGSPDGIWVDPDGRVFVLTDGTQPGGANDQMLVADPQTREFRRLFTGVKGCEVTGITVTPSRTTMFVNLQHPGDGDPNLTNFPAAITGATGEVPRDCTIVITRKNGGIIGT